MSFESTNGPRADQPRVAVIGCGAWGRNIVRCFAQLGALEAVVDNNADTIESLVALFGCRAMSVEQALAAPDIDAIVIATPPSGHKDLALAAIARGKHVFIEKPVTLDHGEAVAIVAAARDASRVMMTGHILQFHPAYRKLKELVGAGALGRLQRINANRLNLGAVRREEDALWCLAPHDVSMTLGLVGAAPDHIDAHGEGHLRDAIADAVTLRLGFAGGEMALIHVSWLHPYKEHRLSVIGSQAMAVFDDTLPWERKLQIYPHQVCLDGASPQVVRAEPVPVEITQNEPLLAECAHFLDCIRDGSEPMTGPTEALAVMDVLERAQQSMRGRNRPVASAGA
ncbi:MAG: putative dehydrogenase [Saliniramus fredricksonii]|uniref:Predicted dehydrogenase n=1 Tax=Saliniramus fredricksonii TaxID=1653334 RepID=A0A0P8A1P2_9HYPH|nr:Gfo/Idh/MocA family oxidoreductase [Saliniramus fredricksonii]KPQ09070.1 MAG: putative dehydrogenase [Saliniramus fredricksonii]SCC78318.1 Predicted dehydrogenase [Saliniramus fredricksonii]